MRAYLIDPFPLLRFAAGELIDPTELVREVEHTGEIEDIYDHLSLPHAPVEEFECLRHPSFPDSLYIDVRGALREPPQFWFTYYRCPKPLTGRGLLCGIDEHGNNCDPVDHLESTRERVSVGYDNVEWTATRGLRRLDVHVLEHWQEREWLNIEGITFSQY